MHTEYTILSQVFEIQYFLFLCSVLHSVFVKKGAKSVQTDNCMKNGKITTE